MIHEHREQEHKLVRPTTSDTRVNITWYDDGCVRFRIFASPLVVRELYISSKSGKPSIITVAPNVDGDRS